MKLAGSNPAPAAAPTSAPADSPSPAPDMGGAEPSSDKPFNDEPFDAGVEADENTDPKQFIEQLTGKLGQSLRKYNEAQGQPDFELEKFAINSLLSATHTAEMPPDDQEDIIKKIKEAGKGDNEASDEDKAPDTEMDANNDSSDSEMSGEFIGAGGQGGAPDTSGGASGGSGLSEEKSQVEKDNPMLYPDGWKEMDGIFMNPKKNNMFQKGSNDILRKTAESLNNPQKSSIFDEIKSRLKETFNPDDTMSEPMEPQVQPQVQPKPNPTKVEPNPAPSRKNKPFLPMPDVKPDPKAKK